LTTKGEKTTGKKQRKEINKVMKEHEVPQMDKRPSNKAFVTEHKCKLGGHTCLLLVKKEEKY
jgi:hypothetical protein